MKKILALSCTLFFGGLLGRAYGQAANPNPSPTMDKLQGLSVGEQAAQVVYDGAAPGPDLVQAPNSTPVPGVQGQGGAQDPILVTDPVVTVKPKKQNFQQWAGKEGAKFGAKWGAIGGGAAGLIGGGIAMGLLMHGGMAFWPALGIGLAIAAGAALLFAGIGALVGYFVGRSKAKELTAPQNS